MIKMLNKNTLIDCFIITLLITDYIGIMSYVGYTYSAPTYPIGTTFDANNLVTNLYSAGITGYSFADIQGPLLTIAFFNAISPTNKSTLDNLVLNNATIINTLSYNTTPNIFNAVVATTTGGILSSNFIASSVIDNYTLAFNDTILIKNQSNPVENGLYQVNLTGAPTRSGIAANTNAGNALINVNRGTANGGTQWICTNAFGSDVAGQTGLFFSLIGYPKVISTSSVGSNGTEIAAINSNQVIYRLPYSGSSVDGLITGASIISRINTPGVGNTYSVRLQTSGLKTIGFTSTLTTDIWQTNVLDITNPENIPTIRDVLSFVITLTGSSAYVQYAEIVL